MAITTNASSGCTQGFGIRKVKDGSVILDSDISVENQLVTIIINATEDLNNVALQVFTFSNSSTGHMVDSNNFTLNIEGKHFTSGDRGNFNDFDCREFWDR